MKVVFHVVHNLAVPLLEGTSYVDRFAKVIFSSEGKIVPYNYKPVPDLAFKNIPEKYKDKDRDELAIEEDVPRLMRVARQTKILARSEGTVLVTSGTEFPVKIDTLLEWTLLKRE